MPRPAQDRAGNSSDLEEVVAGAQRNLSRDQGQRYHWSTTEVAEALEASGLRCVAALGQREEGARVLLSDSPDEERDAKVVYIAAHAA